jgi:hypothetical protein
MIINNDNQIYKSTHARMTIGSGDRQEIPDRDRCQSTKELIVNCRSRRTRDEKRSTSHVVMNGISLIENYVIARLETITRKSHGDLVGAY